MSRGTHSQSTLKAGLLIDITDRRAFLSFNDFFTCTPDAFKASLTFLVTKCNTFEPMLKLSLLLRIMCTVISLI